MKLLPLILSGLAAVSFSVFAQQSPTQPTPGADKGTHAGSDTSGAAPADTVNKQGSKQSDASTGASGDAKGDKPRKAKKAKKAKKDEKASSGSSATTGTHADTKVQAGSASSGASSDPRKADQSATTGDKPQDSKGSAQ